MRHAFEIALSLALMLPCTAQELNKALDKNGHIVPLKTEAESPQPALVVVSMSPDKHWLFCHQHYGSHWGENYLYRSDDGVTFAPARKESDKAELESRRRYARDMSITSGIEAAENFDRQAWKFFCKAEGVSRNDIDIVEPAEFVSWTADGSRLLFSLTSRLGLTNKELDAPVRRSNTTVSGYVSPRGDPKKPGVEDWRAYFNLTTQRFELSDELRASNKDARKRWAEHK